MKATFDPSTPQQPHIERPHSVVVAVLHEKKYPKKPRDKESGLPKGYVSGLSVSTAKKRAAHWKRTSKMDPKNQAAYEPAPGDKTAKTKESKYTRKYREMYGEENDEFVELTEAADSALKKKSDKSGVPLSTLKTVYRRGVAAWRTGHRPGTTPQQWGFARVNSYISKGKTYHTADKDLREEHYYADTIKTIKRVVSEATYKGKQVTLNKPFRTPSGPKKSAVYVDSDKDGKAEIVRFGDPNMRIKKNIPARRRSFRARHNCDTPGPKNKARYWSCRAW